MKTKKQYDFSSLNELFNECLTPEQLREELVELAFDYAQNIEEGSTKLFKSNMSTIYVLCDALKNVK